MISIARSTNVKNWQNGTMALRRCAAGMIEAGKQFRRVNGHLQLPALRTALDEHVAARTVGAVRHVRTFESSSRQPTDQLAQPTTATVVVSPDPAAGCTTSTPPEGVEYHFGVDGTTRFWNTSGRRGAAMEVYGEDMAGEVEVAHPPKALMRVGNPIGRFLLRSPYGRRMTGQALLRFSGRKTGAAYAVVVSWHEVDGNQVVVSPAQWRLNFTGGAN